jgi:Matrixin/FG-GAP-like repeat
MLCFQRRCGKSLDFGVAVILNNGRSSPMFSPKRFETTRIVSCRARVKFAAVLMIAATTFLMREASGYALEGPKWASSPVMRLSLGNAGRVLIDGNTSWNYAAAPALDMWNQVITRIQLGRVFSSGPQPAEHDGINSMAFSDTIFGQTWPPSAYAVTITWHSGSTITEADVLFNSTKSWDSYRGPLRLRANGQLKADIQRVAVHELGHAIGLDHPDDAGQYVDAIMNSIISGRYTLAVDDVVGVQHLYASPLKNNILAQNSSTGQRLMWVSTYSNGFVDFSSFNLGTVSTQWNIMASADFNANGSADIVWQNSSNGQSVLWFMNGAAHVGGAVLPTVPPHWEIATAADFNGDRKPDLLLQNMATGQRVIWFMNGTTHTGGWNLGTVPTAWKITSSADFNSDGKTDILWQNSTGLRAIWLMNRTQLIGVLSLWTVSTALDIVGTCDFNRDGKADIVWQNQTTGQVLIWLMNGTTPIGTDGAGLYDGPQWKIRNY